MSKAKLWIIYYCILEMEADNEPAISLPKSHYGSWSTGIYEKTKQKDKKQKKESFHRRESNPGPPRYLLPHDNYSRLPITRTFKGNRK